MPREAAVLFGLIVLTAITAGVLSHDIGIRILVVFALAVGAILAAAIIRSVP